MNNSVREIIICSMSTFFQRRKQNSMRDHLLEDWSRSSLFSRIFGEIKSGKMKTEWLESVIESEEHSRWCFCELCDFSIEFFIVTVLAMVLALSVSFSSRSDFSWLSARACVCFFFSPFSFVTIVLFDTQRLLESKDLRRQPTLLGRLFSSDFMDMESFYYSTRNDQVPQKQGIHCWSISCTLCRPGRLGLERKAFSSSSESILSCLWSEAEGSYTRDGTFN